MTRTYNCSIFLFLFLSFSLLLPSFAQGKNKENLFKAGVTNFNNGNYEAAAKSFRAAYEAKPSWKILYNIGQSEAAAKQYDLALEAFEAYLAQGGDDIDDERREEVLTEVNRLREMVGSIEVYAPDGAVIFVDDINRGTAPLLGKLTVSASTKHQIYAVLDGNRIGQREFQVRGKDALSIDLRDSEKTKPAGVAGAKASGIESASSSNENEVNENTDDSIPDDLQSGIKPKRSPLVIAGGVVAGLGAGALIAAIVTGVIAKDLDNQLKTKCPGGVCDEVFLDDKNKMENLQGTTNILLISGGTVAAVGVTLLITGLVKKRKSISRTALSPFVRSTALGLNLQGSF